MNEIYQVREIQIDAFKKIYDSYLFYDFPEAERKSFETIATMAKNGDYRFFLLEDDNSALQAYATFVGDATSTIVLLDYFAVVSTKRGEGIGSYFLQQLIKIMQVDGFLIECESPRLAKNNEEKSVREKRVSFYQNNGAQLTDVEMTIVGVSYVILYLPVQKKELSSDVRQEMEMLYQTKFPKKY